MFKSIKKSILKKINKRKQFFLFKQFISSGDGSFEVNWKNRFIILNENTSKTEFDRHYIYHPAWAARILSRIKPTVHYDISSFLSFSTILSAFIPVKFYDYRPAALSLSNLDSNHADLTQLNFDDNSIPSLSCMHTVEHIGLGRYGDEIDFFGDFKAMKELARVLAPNGNLLFVTPVGKKNIIQFNAHRIYEKDFVIKRFEDFGLKLVEFSLIPELAEDGGLVIDPSPKLLNQQSYACGCFWFTK